MTSPYLFSHPFISISLHCMVSVYVVTPICNFQVVVRSLSKCILSCCGSQLDILPFPCYSCFFPESLPYSPSFFNAVQLGMCVEFYCTTTFVLHVKLNFICILLLLSSCGRDLLPVKFCYITTTRFTCKIIYCMYTTVYYLLFGS